MKKYYSSLLKFLFIAAVTCIIVIGAVIFAFGKRPTYSDLEKRELTKKPSVTFKGLVTGSYFTDLQSYYNDTVPGREGINVTGNRFSVLKGVSFGDIIIVDPGEKNRPTEPPADMTDEPPEERSFIPIWGTATPTDGPTSTPDSAAPSDQTQGPEKTR